MIRRRAWAALPLGFLLLAAAVPVPVAGSSHDRLPGVVLPGGTTLHAYRGDLHAHTAYSDGTLRPLDAFAAAKGTGEDFFAVTEHSEWFVFPFEANEDCIRPTFMECLATPLPDRTEWEDVRLQAMAATDAGFLGLRGFEWSSPVEGHVNVFFTTTWTDTVLTGPAPMAGFYAWLAANVVDADRIATFNHPGREELMFDGFAYVAPMDPFFVAVEAFNRRNDWSQNYLVALDKGWHAGAIGVTDGHSPADWTDPLRGRTILLATSLTEAGLREALLAGRSVAVRGSDLDARLRVDGALMGATISPAGPAVSVAVDLLDGSGDAFTMLELRGPNGYAKAVPITTGSSVSATVDVTVADLPATDAGERYLLARAWQGTGSAAKAVVVTSPVWIA